MPSDTWVITSYFNPCRYRTRRQNFDLFAQHMDDIGANVFVVEMATESGDFELSLSNHGLQIRNGSNLWQKERMLNVAIDMLPQTCTKVVWLDCDVIFEDPKWLAKTSQALEHFAVVQPFAECVRLRQSERPETASKPYAALQESFSAAFTRAPELAHFAPYAQHGHTGFAWAARRDILHGLGLYDACLTGSGDHLMAHVFVGALASPCIAAMIGEGHAYAHHFQRWAAAMHARCDGALGHVPGRVFHLWHGDEENRRYRDHNTTFRAFDFDPERDIRHGPGGLWEWVDAESDMNSWAMDMLQSRKEDG